jgi:thymidylate synthase (FAD)
MKVELINYTQNPIQAIESAASVCYDSKNTVPGKIFQHCCTSGHLSVLEFADFTFKVSGISRVCANQLIRHRVGTSFAQRSQRYCEEDGFEYITPLSISSQENVLDIYTTAMRQSQAYYEELIAKGIPREDARMVLPNACTTQIVVQMNLRSLAHFCNERLCACAQSEIRQLASQMKALVAEIDPLCAQILVPKCEINSLNICPEGRRSCGKHPYIDKANAQGEQE